MLGGAGGRGEYRECPEGWYHTPPPPPNNICTHSHTTTPDLKLRWRLWSHGYLMSLSLREHYQIFLLQGAGDSSKAWEKVFSGQHKYKQRCAARIQRQLERDRGSLGTSRSFSFPSMLLEEWPSTLRHPPQIPQLHLGWIRRVINCRFSIEWLWTAAVVPVPISFSLLGAAQCMKVHYAVWKCII